MTQSPNILARSNVRGMTLTEVMVALVIVAVGVGSVVATQANLIEMRRRQDEQRKAREVGESVMNAIQGMSWTDLNNHGDANTALSWCRLPDNNASATRLDDDLPASVSATGYLSDGMSGIPVTGLDHLRVYVEYFRAIPATDASGAVIPGLEGGLFTKANGAPLNSPQDQRTGVPGCAALAEADPPPGNPLIAYGKVDPARLPTASATIRQYRLGDGGNPANVLSSAISTLSGAQIGANDPVAIVITVMWVPTAWRSDPTTSSAMALTLVGGKKP